MKQNNEYKMIKQFHDKIEKQYKQKYSNYDVYPYDSDISYKIINNFYEEMNMCFSINVLQPYLEYLDSDSICNMCIYLYPNQYTRIDSIGNELLKEGLELVEKLGISTEESNRVDMEWWYYDMYFKKRYRLY